MFVARVRGDRPPEFLFLSPSARVPLVVEITQIAAKQLKRQPKSQSLTSSSRGAHVRIWRSANSDTVYVSGECGASAYTVAPHDATLLRRLEAQTKLAAHGQGLTAVYETWQAGGSDLWGEPLRRSRSDASVPPPSLELLGLFRAPALTKGQKGEVGAGGAFANALEAEESARKAEKERRKAEKLEAKRRAEEEERRRQEELERQRMEEQRLQKEREARAREAALAQQKQQEEEQKKAAEARARAAARKAAKSPRGANSPASKGFGAFAPTVAAPSPASATNNIFDMSSGGFGSAFGASPAEAKTPSATDAFGAFGAFDAFPPAAKSPAMPTQPSNVFDAFSDMSIGTPTTRSTTPSAESFDAFAAPAKPTTPTGDVFSAAFAKPPGTTPVFSPPPSSASAGGVLAKPPSPASPMFGSVLVSEDVTATYSGTRIMQMQIEGNVSVQVTGVEQSPAPKAFQVRVVDRAQNLQAAPMANPKLAQPVPGTPNLYRFLQPAGAPSHHPVLKYRVKAGGGPGALRPVPIKVNRIVRQNPTGDASQVSIQIVVNPSLGYPLDLHEMTVGLRDPQNRSIVGAKGSNVEGGRYNGSDSLVWALRPPKPLAPGSKVVFTAQVKYNAPANPAAPRLGGSNLPKRALGDAQVKLSASDRKLSSLQVSVGLQEPGASMRSQMKSRVRYIHNVLPEG